MKYMGSKSRIAKYLVPIIQNYIDTNHIAEYIEPYLIALFKHLQGGGELLPTVSRELFNEVKTNKQNYESWTVGNVGFLASYNGRGFEGGMLLVDMRAKD